ncbi:MAG: hypothetical protein ACFB0B_13420 [Thermonemataceae bacterium]
MIGIFLLFTLIPSMRQVSDNALRFEYTFAMMIVAAVLSFLLILCINLTILFLNSHQLFFEGVLFGGVFFNSIFMIAYLLAVIGMSDKLLGGYDFSLSTYALIPFFLFSILIQFMVYLAFLIRFFKK